MRRRPRPPVVHQGRGRGPVAPERVEEAIPFQQVVLPSPFGPSTVINPSGSSSRRVSRVVAEIPELDPREPHHE